MRFPQEIVVQRFLPTYRALLAQALSEGGLPQKRVADLVGVTQAQVSKYLADKTPVDPRLAEDPRVQQTVAAVAGGLAAGRLSTVEALGESLALVGRLQAGGPLARMHEEEMPALAGTGFDATLDPDSVAMQEHRVLTELRWALRRLAGVPGLAGWVPHVGSNLAQARAGAEDVWDIAALPGRIDAVGGTVRATTDPAFGGSQHVATVVLGVMDVAPERRAALNLAYRDRLPQMAEDAGLSTARIEADYEGRREHVADRVAAHAADEGGPPDVLFHEGAFGIEPVSYLLAQDAGEVVESLGHLLAPPDR